MKHRMLPLCLLLGGIVGCASTAPPNQQMEQAKVALAQAENAGATRYDAALEQLQRARTEYDRAMELMGAGDHTGAAAMLDRANADAELAQQLARLGEARSLAEGTLWNVHTLDEEPVPR